jgi:hypothetical protein
MKAKELMIGDWVMPLKKKLKGIPGKVITIDGGTNVCWIDSKDYSCLVPCSDVERIPLTPEILEKNGFEKFDFSHFQIGDRRLVLDADGRWAGPLSWHWVVTEMDTNAKGQPVVLDYYVATINYVHELQHALRLCGIYKEIVVC